MKVIEVLPGLIFRFTESDDGQFDFYCNQFGQRQARRCDRARAGESGQGFGQVAGGHHSRCAALREFLEDYWDTLEVRRQVKRGEKAIPWEQLKKNLGLDR